MTGKPMDPKTNSISYGSWTIVFFGFFMLFATATAREAIPMGYGALTTAGFSLAAYLANRFGRGGIAKLLFFLGFLAGFGVAGRGLLTMRRSAHRANPPAESPR